jgi:Insertion element 4 transposase N-terminal/Transposase DDE domain
VLVPGDGEGGGFSFLTDAIGIGTLTRLVPRELVDEIVASHGRTEIRKNKIPARVVVYFVMALSLFYGEGYEEVVRKLTAGLKYIGTWKREWSVPTSSGLCQARQRLGADVMRDLFDRVAVPCALRSTAGAWLSGRRLMAVDGVGLEAFDSEENAVYFGYAGKKEKCSFPFVHMAAMIECGTHAVVAAEIGKSGEGEDTLSRRILSGGAVEQDMVVMADAGLYSYQSLRLIIDARADAIFRVGANVGLPLVQWLPDGSYLSYITEPGEKSRHYRKIRNGNAKATDYPGTPVRVVDYEVTDRGDRGEIITLVTTIMDPGDVTAVELAAAYHERWEAELVFDEIKTQCR